MKRITSIADLLFKCETDCRYKWLIIYSYTTPNDAHCRPCYKIAIQWIQDWVSDNLRNNFYKDCNPMVEYLNSHIETVENDKRCNKHPID